jgi:hypothetical protein
MKAHDLDLMGGAHKPLFNPKGRDVPWLALTHRMVTQAPLRS